jgi:hypothetical protein
MILIGCFMKMGVYLTAYFRPTVSSCIHFTLYFPSVQSRSEATKIYNSNLTSAEILAGLQE